MLFDSNTLYIVLNLHAYYYDVAKKTSTLSGKSFILTISYVFCFWRPFLIPIAMVQLGAEFRACFGWEQV